MDQSNTVELISRCRAGDVAAVETLVHTHQTLVYRLALSILDDPAEADEATQDALVAAINRLDSFRGDSAFTTWLYAITLNVCRGRLRKRRSRDRLTQVLQSMVRMSGSSPAHPEKVVMRRETDVELWSAIQTLNDKLREVVVLRYYHKLKLEDIAQSVGVSERAVRDRLHRAHERIREILTDRIEFYEDV